MTKTRPTDSGETTQTQTRTQTPAVLRHPQTLAVTIADDLHLAKPNEIASLAGCIARAAFEADYQFGPAPSSVAASSVYLAGRLVHGISRNSDAPTQPEVGDAADVGERTIQAYYVDLAAVADNAGVAEQYDDRLREILETDE